MLHNGSVSDVQAVNSCVDEAIKVVSVNKQHMELFFALYVRLLDRLFGEEVTRSINSLTPVEAPPANGSIGGTTTWVKGAPGGWIRSFGENSRFSSVSTKFSPDMSYLDRFPAHISSFLQKFTPFSPFFDILSRIQGGFEIKLSLLPSKLQLFLAEHQAYLAVSNNIEETICRSLLRTPLHMNTQVRLCIKYKVLFDIVLIAKQLFTA